MTTKAAPILYAPSFKESSLKTVELTCIDPVTNLVELIRIDEKTSRHVRDKFIQSWLCRYPRPNRCIHDNGGEFIGYPFQELLQRYGVSDVATTVKNPQGNSICERMHQTVANILRTLIHLHPPETVQQASTLVDNALATVTHALRCAVGRTTGVSPGSLAFNRDMLLDIPLITDMLLLQQNRQAIVDENLRRQNAKRYDYDYKIGDSVLIKEVDPVKLQPRAHGPYPVVQVHTNGTIEVQRSPGVLERLSIRRVVPFRS